MIKIFFLILSLFLVFSGRVEAKLLPRAKGAARYTSRSQGYFISAKLRDDRQAVLVTFNNAQQVSSITYTLSYQTNGKEEGIGGTIEPAGQQTINRELLFGTCSSGDCTYHGNITDAKLEIVSTLSNGRQLTKKYKIRV